MIKIIAGYRYDIQGRAATRVATRHGRSQGGEYVTVDTVSAAKLYKALRRVSGRLAAAVSGGECGDFCLAWREDIRQVEAAMA